MSRIQITTNDLAMNAKVNNLTWTAVVSASGHYYTDDGNTILFAMNGDSGSHTVTVVSVSDRYGRTGDLVMTVAARASNHDGLSVFGLPTGAEWRQAGTDSIYVNASADTAMQVAAVRVNRNG